MAEKEFAEAEAKKIIDVASMKALEVVAVAEKAARDIIAINGQPGQGGNIMKELSDIKSSLAVNTNETSTIKNNINEIKGDIKEIKNDFVNRREFNEALKTLREEIKVGDTETKRIWKIIYFIIAPFGLAVIGSIISQVFNKP